MLTTSRNQDPIQVEEGDHMLTTCRPQTGWDRGLMILTPDYLITNQSEESP